MADRPPRPCPGRSSKAYAGARGPRRVSAVCISDGRLDTSTRFPRRVSFSLRTPGGGEHERLMQGQEGRVQWTGEPPLTAGRRPDPQTTGEGRWRRRQHRCAVATGTESWATAGHGRGRPGTWEAPRCWRHPRRVRKSTRGDPLRGTEMGRPVTSKRMKSRDSEGLARPAHGSTIHSGQQLEATPVSVGR